MITVPVFCISLQHRVQETIRGDSGAKPVPTAEKLFAYRRKSMDSRLGNRPAISKLHALPVVPHGAICARFASCTACHRLHTSRKAADSHRVHCTSSSRDTTSVGGRSFHAQSLLVSLDLWETVFVRLTWSSSEEFGVSRCRKLMGSDS